MHIIAILNTLYTQNKITSDHFIRRLHIFPPRRTKNQRELRLNCETLASSYNHPVLRRKLHNKYATDENGRIRAVDGSAKDCAIFIAAVKPIDEGNWHCNVTTKKYGGRHHVGHKRIQVKTFYRDELLNATFFEYE